MATRYRPAGAGIKPPQAAAVKSRGSERWVKGGLDSLGDRHSSSTGYRLRMD